MNDKNDPHHSRPFYTTKEEFERISSKPKRIKYPLAFQDYEFIMREELRPVRLQLELLKPELLLRDNKIENTIVFFGSARIPHIEVAEQQLKLAEDFAAKFPDDEKAQKNLRSAQKIHNNSSYLEQATRLAYLISTDPDNDFVVVTGGGPSFMEAANKGAHQANKRSIALGILLPHEQDPNPYVTPELTFQFHYFAIRKMHFLMRAKALVAFPGGFGTCDELFESLTLLQTEKIDPIPLILFNEKFWRDVCHFEKLVEHGTISENDLDLIKYVETAEQAQKHIKDFYKNKS